MRFPYYGGPLNEAELEKMLQNESEEWKFTNLIIMSDSVREGYFRLNASHYDGKRATVSRNISINDTVPVFLLCISRNAAYVIETRSIELDRLSSKIVTSWRSKYHEYYYIEVTEFVNNHKTRRFRRWFHDRKETWEVTNYAPSQP